MEENEVKEETIVEETKQKPVKKKSKKKILIIFILSLLILIIVGGIIFFLNNSNKETLPPLPKPEITSGKRGEFGIDKNINEETIDNYLGRSDSVYRDMRMLEDPAKYENIGGDRFLSGYIKGFEVIPLPYIIPVEGLPEEVGNTYYGNTLFREENGKYIANYKESNKILEQIFPKDKVIFLMCGGGGYAGMTKNFLISMGYDENKIYNVGGHWYYKGKNNIEVPKKEINGQLTYDFSKVPYHKIDFDKLTKSTNYKESKYKVSELKINTDKIELEEGATFKLNVIVLPNEAKNKEVKWISKDESVAKVSEEGTVTGIKEGTTTIIVESVDGKKTVTCEVIIKKKPTPPKIKLDNLISDANEFNSYNFAEISQKFTKTVYDENGKPRDGYFNEDYSTTNLWKEAYDKYQKEMEDAQNRKTQIINKLIDNKKTFIILIHTPSCDEEDFQVATTASKILKENGYSYFYVDADYEDKTLEKSKIDQTKLNGGSIMIISKGNVGVAVDPNADSLKNEDEVRTWLDKYINLK